MAGEEGKRLKIQLARCVDTEKAAKAAASRAWSLGKERAGRRGGPQGAGNACDSDKSLVELRYRTLKGKVVLYALESGTDAPTDVNVKRYEFSKPSPRRHTADNHLKDRTRRRD